MTTKQQKAWRMPDTYVIIFFVVLLAALLTYVIPLGNFDVFYRALDANGNEIASVIDGEVVTFQANGVNYTIDASGDKTVVSKEGAEEPIGSMNKNKAKSIEAADDNGNLVFTAVQELGKYNSTGETKGIKVFEKWGDMGFLNFAFEGLVKGDKWGTSVGVIAFILIVGGSFGIILKTGAFEAGVFSLIKKFRNADLLLIPALFLAFSAGGAVFGMGEEAIPFAMIVVPIMVAMGYDAIVGIMITYGATQIGFATSAINPFSVAIAQSISGLAVGSGSGYRWIMWAVFTLFGIGFTMWYGRRIKKNPQISVAYESDEYFRNDFKEVNMQKIEFKLGHSLILIYILLAIVWIMWGIKVHGYYLPEIATIFFTIGLLSGITAVIFKLNDMTVNGIASSFRNGATDLVGAALVVGLAQGIILVLGDSSPGSSSVLNTILSGMANVLNGLPTALSAWFMYIFQSCFNFFVVSGSGQAAVTMPLMAPLAQLIGVSKQVAVLAFQLGDGLTNLIVPTSGCLMGVLGVAKLDWAKWAKFQIKLQGLLFLLGSVFVILAVIIGF
ncbi:MAG: putative basic amino acid antiporter YfcC [Bacillota bacterium]